MQSQDHATRVLAFIEKSRRIGAVQAIALGLSAPGGQFRSGLNDQHAFRRLLSRPCGHDFANRFCVDGRGKSGQQGQSGYSSADLAAPCHLSRGPYFPLFTVLRDDRGNLRADGFAVFQRKLLVTLRDLVGGERRRRNVALA